MKTAITLAASVAALAFSSPALAANTIFNWTGNCEDCATAAMQALYPASATLEVTNYTLGDEFTNSHFVSFSYSPTNLVPGGLDVLPPALEFLRGSIGAAPGTYDVDIGAVPLSFRTLQNGNFDVYSILIADFGTGTWSIANNNSGVPEPATWAMMLLGFAAVGASMRRKQHTARVRFAF